MKVAERFHTFLSQASIRPHTVYFLRSLAGEVLREGLFQIGKRLGRLYY